MGGDPRNVDLKAAALVTLLALIWAGNPIAIKISLADAPPIRQAWMRFAFGGLTVLAWAWSSRTSLRIVRHEVRPLLILGILFTVQIGLMNLGAKYTSRPAWWWAASPWPTAAPPPDPNQKPANRQDATEGPIAATKGTRRTKGARPLILRPLCFLWLAWRSYGLPVASWR